ncbi:hypothetical protein [Bacillus sp. SM2101]|uniref:hypothetical protein n=1 Tax=Bacillus sp. SM2101 TaxID=2805366 RepID=UPI001BDF3751|nr:hypothetical protein [Bacillus sp. SM2101]
MLVNGDWFKKKSITISLNSSLCRIRKISIAVQEVLTVNESGGDDPLPDSLTF